jgi:DNA-binding MarR family transcriptional regulator
MNHPTARQPEEGPLLSPGFWLLQAALAWRAVLAERLGPLDLTPTQFTLLATVGWLEHTDGPPTQQAVAEHAGADRMMTSKVVRALEGRGLLRREPHPSDARSFRLTLTPAGRASTRRATTLAVEVDAALFGADAAAVRPVLRRIAEERTPTT